MRHGARFEFTSPDSWPAPAQSLTTDTTHYGAAHAQSWDRLHTKLTRVGARTGHEDRGEPPLRNRPVRKAQRPSWPSTVTSDQ